MKTFPFLAAASALAFAAPGNAQTMDHSNMPGMKMPAEPAPKPAAKPRPAPKPATKPAPKSVPPAKPADAKAVPVGDQNCPPEHAEMGHCTPSTPAPPAPTPADPHAGHDMSAMPSGAADAQDIGTGGTALPAGDSPAPAAPEPSYADRVWGREAMIPARDTLRREHGGGTFSQVMIDIAELQIRDGREGYRWEGEGWFGGDINRLVVKTEGEGSFGEAIEDAEVQALYSRAVGPYFNLQGGVRHDFEPKSRTYAAFGIEGLAPYWFEVEAHAFVSTKGDVLGRLAASYDQRITRRLILQPRVEFNLAAQDVRESGVGAGLSDAEFDLRLRYEIAREFAPYIGISYSSKFGRTADFARAAVEDTSATSFVVGIRAWF
jgi:copper resistance protein B